jgi:hypothetical protein
MFKKLFGKWLLRGTKKEIKMFLELFSQGDIEQNGIVIGKAALIHYCLGIVGSEFKKLVNSKVGENQSEITIYNVFQLDRLLKECREANEIVHAAGIKFWSTTFRCMLDESLHHYGVQLWEIASKSFGSAKDYLQSELMQAIETGDKKMEERIKGALHLCDFVPPQFLKK